MMDIALRDGKIIPCPLVKRTHDSKKQMRFLKTSERRVGAVAHAFSCNGPHKPSTEAASAASSPLETISLKSSNNSNYDLLKVVNKKAEYPSMITKSNARQWWESTPLVL